MILLTGFEPFGGQSTNPSWAAAESARDLLRGEGLAVEALELPCVFGAAANVLRSALEDPEPEPVVCIGQAGGRVRVSLERVAINCDDAPVPDNAGNQPVDREVVPGGPAAYFTSLPVKAALRAVEVAGVPAEVSQSAGTYVCNHIFYTLMHELARRPDVRGGFVHVPFAPDQVAQGSGDPSLPLASMAETIAVVVRTSLTRAADVALAGSSIH
jgi:pyroglutamyl-peptidase